MPGIYIAAGVTTALACLAIGLPLWIGAPKGNRTHLLVLGILMLPMNALVFHLVRLPLDSLLAGLLGKSKGMLDLVRVLYAPLTEEPAKLWPILIPWFSKRIRPQNMFRVAFAIGLGFGVGEAWNVGAMLAGNPEVARYPWYMLGGFITERLMVCVMHSAFVVVALHFILKRGLPVTGVLAAMSLHLVGNFPIYLGGRGAFGIGGETWQVILQIWVLLYVMAMGFMVAYMAYGRSWARKLTGGHAKCPECGKVYPHPLLGFNLVNKRYERCPHCGHWHMVSSSDYREEAKSIDG
jgi:DNA-directed RNA polymerase subunit RPC12/RpoP